MSETPKTHIGVDTGKGDDATVTTFFFPKHGISVVADTQEEAEKKLDQLLKSHKEQS